MAFSLSNLFGNSKNESNDSVNSIINSIENKPFGISDDNVMIAGLNELGGYFIFQSVVIGSLKVKTNHGAKLVLKGQDFDLTLSSDMQELESQNSDVKKRYVTRIDFEIDADDVERVQKADIKHIHLTIKKQDILFDRYVASDDEEE